MQVTTKAGFGFGLNIQFKNKFIHKNLSYKPRLSWAKLMIGLTIRELGGLQKPSPLRK